MRGIYDEAFAKSIQYPGIASLERRRRSKSDHDFVTILALCIVNRVFKIIHSCNLPSQFYIRKQQFVFGGSYYTEFY